MINFLKRNKKYFEDLDNNNINIYYKNQIIEGIKNNKTIIIKWFNSSSKTNLISHIVKFSVLKDNYLYINKNLDIDNILKNNNSLEFLLMHAQDYISKPKIIIFENISKIPNIYKFINYLETNNYKTIIISNKLDSLPTNYEKWKANKIIKIPETKILLNNIDYYSSINKNIEKLKTDSIIFEEIIKPYWLKNHDLYKYTLTYLSKLDNTSSIREINRNLNKIIKISLVTMIEYLKYSIEACIINQTYSFDFKKNKQIETKTKYYFTDTIFRNSLYNFELNNNILRENLLYNELSKSWYKINSWINWNYEFSFYGNRINSDLNSSEETEINTIYIDFYNKKISTKPLSWILSPSQEKEGQKKEIKKQINKLLKVPERIYTQQDKTKSFIQTFSKFLIIENTNEIWIKKLQYENVKIISLGELLKII